MVKVTSVVSRFLKTPSSRFRSMVIAESARSIFFFLSKRLMERKFNLHQSGYLKVKALSFD